MKRLTMTLHRFSFGATQCAIQVRKDPASPDATWIAEAVVIADQSHALRWVGGRSGPLEVRGPTQAQALARMQAILDERFGPRGELRPVPPWLFSVPIEPPSEETSAIPIRLVWTDGSPDTLTTVPKREPELEVVIAGAGPGRVTRFRLTEERDSGFRWVYTQLLELLVSLAIVA